MRIGAELVILLMIIGQNSQTKVSVHGNPFCRFMGQLRTSAPLESYRAPSTYVRMVLYVKSIMRFDHYLVTFRSPVNMWKNESNQVS
jgi:hypothetical protein